MNKIFILLSIFLLTVVPSLGQGVIVVGIYSINNIAINSNNLIYTIVHKNNLNSTSGTSLSANNGQNPEITTIEFVSDIEKSPLHLNRVFFLEGEYYRNQDIKIALDLENELKTDLKNVIVTVSIPELGIRRQSFKEDIKKHRDELRYVTIAREDIPHWAHGEYAVRITVSNDDFERTIYRIVNVE